jgi:hypothetical protein
LKYSELSSWIKVFHLLQTLPAKRPRPVFSPINKSPLHKKHRSPFEKKGKAKLFQIFSPKKFAKKMGKLLCSGSAVCGATSPTSETVRTQLTNSVYLPQYYPGKRK